MGNMTENFQVKHLQRNVNFNFFLCRDVETETDIRVKINV